MKTEQPTKKGFFAILKEAFTKSGGCCGAGETCGTPSKEADTAQPKEVQKSKEADKPVQK
jgi:hypothetical protein